MTDTELRERVARIANEICGCATPEQRRRDIALIEAEIDRRVAEEKAKLLERLRVPSEDALRAGCNKIDWERSRQEHMPTAPNGIVNLNSTFLTPGATTIGQDMLDAWQAMLSQFEKENSHEQG